MDPDRNPYEPGAGTRPPELAGRSELLDEATVALRRLSRGKTERSVIFVGLRGVGKTVLLNDLQDRAEELRLCAAVIECIEERSLPEVLVPELRRILFELDRMGALSMQTKRAFRVLASFARGVKLRATQSSLELGLDIDPEPGVADSGDLNTDLAQLLAAVADAASERKRAVVLFMDELQYLRVTEFGALIAGLHRIAQRSRLVSLVGAGLPQIRGIAGSAKSYAERLFLFREVGALSDADARSALLMPAEREGVSFTEAAIGRIATLTQGYPYFLQEWGYHTWNAAVASPITEEDVERGSVRALRRLDEGFFRVRFDRLTKSEKRYLVAMAHLGPGPHRSGEIAEVYGAKATRVGPVRDKLIHKGMIYAPAHGETAFTVPLFDAYLKRIVPSLQE